MGRTGIGLQVKLVFPGGSRPPEIQAELVVPDGCKCPGLQVKVWIRSRSMEWTGQSSQLLGLLGVPADSGLGRWDLT